MSAQDTELLGSPVLPIAGSVHQIQIFSVNLSPHISSISRDNTLRVWQFPTVVGAPYNLCYDKQFPVMPLCHLLSPDSRNMLLGMEDGTLVNLDIATQTFETIKANYSGVRTAKWSDAGIVITGGWDGWVKCYTTNPFRLIDAWCFFVPVHAVDISGMEWVAITDGPHVFHKDMANRTRVSRLDMHPGRNPYVPVDAQLPAPGCGFRTIQIRDHTVSFGGGDGHLYKLTLPTAPGVLTRSHPAIVDHFTVQDHGVVVTNPQGGSWWKMGVTHGVQLHERYAALITHGSDGLMNIWFIPADGSRYIQTASYPGAVPGPITAGAWLPGTNLYAYAVGDDGPQDGPTPPGAALQPRLFIHVFNDDDFGPIGVRRQWPEADVLYGALNASANTGNWPANAQMNAPPANAPGIGPVNAPTYAPQYGPANAPGIGPVNAPTYAPQYGPANALTYAPTTAPTNATTNGLANTATNTLVNGPLMAPSTNVQPTTALSRPAIAASYAPVTNTGINLNFNSMPPSTSSGTNWTIPRPPQGAASWGSVPVVSARASASSTPAPWRPPPSSGLTRRAARATPAAATTSTTSTSATAPPAGASSSTTSANAAAPPAQPAQSSTANTSSNVAGTGSLGTMAPIPGPPTV